MFSRRMGGRGWMMARNPGEERAACAHTGSVCGAPLVGRSCKRWPSNLRMYQSPLTDQTYSIFRSTRALPPPFLPCASSRTSAPVTHRRSNNPRIFPLRFEAVASFLFNHISFDLPLFHPFPGSSPIVRRAFFAYPFGVYVTEQIGDGEPYVGPYLRLSRPMYRDRGKTCGC